MAEYMTSETLIDSIKRRASVPEQQATFTEADFLALANEEMISGVVPTVMSLHEDFFLFEEEVELVADQSDYTIPYRAIGNGLRDVQAKDSNGNLFEMVRVSIGDAPDYQGSFRNDRPYTYAIVNNKVRILPGVGSSVTGSLVFIYYIRPSQLVSESRIAVITAIDTNTGVVTLDSFPSHFSLSITMDFYQVNSPHRPLAINLSPTAVDSSSNTVTFDVDDLPNDLSVGDHLSQATECIIPQIPADLHPMLAQRVAERIMESQGDSEGLQNAKVKVAEMELKSGTIIDDRVDESPIKAVNKNSALKSGLFQKRYKRRSF